MMKKLIYSLAVLMVGITLQSCLHDNNDDFDKSADERMTEALNNDRTTLESATNGWHLQYFLGNNYLYGGYNYLVKFNRGKVSLWTELGGNLIEKSDYTLNGDQGPVLSLNTYNNLIHSFCEGQSGNVDGFEGDYEFIIQKVTQDTIYIKGKKWGNKMIMTRMPESVTWKDEAKKLSDMNANFIYSTYKVNVNGDSIANISINTPMERLATVTYGGQTSYAAFVVTESGLRFAQPLNINGVTLQMLTYHTDTNKFSVDGTSNADLSFYKSAGYKPIDFYEGKWQLYDRNGADLVFSLKANADNRGLTATCDKYPWPLTFKYNVGSGSISLNSQSLGVTKLSDGNSYHITLCAYSGETGYFSWASNAGMTATPSENGDTLSLADSGTSGIGTITSFFTVAFTSVTPSNNTLSMDATTQLTDYFLWDVKKMVKKK